MTVPPGAEKESELFKAFKAAATESNRVWNDGDVRGAYGILPDDFEYQLADTWPQARALHGREEVIAFFEDFQETFPDARAEGLKFTPAGERTFVLGFEVTGTGASSGVGATMEIWQVWEVTQDLVPVRVREYSDRGAALEAAGKVS